MCGQGEGLLLERVKGFEGLEVPHERIAWTAIIQIWVRARKAFGSVRNRIQQRGSEQPPGASTSQ